MEGNRTRKRKNSTLAMSLLFAEGCFFLVLGAVVLSCGFVLNFHDDFDLDKVKTEFDYPQYWIGFTFLITAFVAMAAGARQRNSWLVLTALILFLLCIFASLFALVVEGNDWIRHKTAARRKSFWNSEDDYSCESDSSTCACTNAKTKVKKWISLDFDCSMLDRLSHTYGAMVCCVLVGIFLALSSIVIVLILIPMKHFTVPEPKQKIKRITVLEEKELEPETRIVYRPKKIQQPEIEEIVVRERKPRRQRTIVYDEPTPQPRPPVRTLVPIEIPVETQPAEQIVIVDDVDRGDTGRMISHIYDEGRLQVAEPEPRPPREPSPLNIDRQFVTNPNFGKTAPKVSRHVEEPAAPVLVREATPKYVTRRRDLVHSEEPRVVYVERRPMAVKSRYPVHREKIPREYSREKHRVFTVDQSRAYADGVYRYPAIQGRPRANSGDRPRHLVLERHRAYASERPRVYAGEMRREVQYGRPRAYSDEGPRMYGEPQIRDGPQMRDRPQIRDVPHMHGGPQMRDGPLVRDGPQMRGPLVRDVPQMHGGPQMRDGPLVRDGPQMRDRPQIRDDVPQIHGGLQMRDGPQIHGAPHVHGGPQMRDGPQIRDAPQIHGGPQMRGGPLVHGGLPLVHGGPQIHGGPQVYGGAKPRLFRDEQFAPAMQARPLQGPNPQGYDKELEDNLQTADKWGGRVPTPY